MRNCLSCEFGKKSRIKEFRLCNLLLGKLVQDTDKCEHWEKPVKVEKEE